LAVKKPHEKRSASSKKQKTALAFSEDVTPLHDTATITEIRKNFGEDKEEIISGKNKLKAPPAKTTEKKKVKIRLS